jgi:protein-S-isoprenylcysteine O-methyltransferase Ste14
MWLALRSIAWIVLLPGMVAGYVPWRFFGLSHVHVAFCRPAQLLGLLAITVGALLLGTCIWEFAVTGRGTLSPVDPPRELVVRRLYRYVRNPMYLSVSTILIGELILIQTGTFLGYLLLWIVAVNLFVIAYEEPTLRKNFGASYGEYLSSVNRWIPSVPSKLTRR